MLPSKSCAMYLSGVKGNIGRLFERVITSYSIHYTKLYDHVFARQVAVDAFVVAVRSEMEPVLVRGLVKVARGAEFRRLGHGKEVRRAKQHEQAKHSGCEGLV